MKRLTLKMKLRVCDPPRFKAYFKEKYPYGCPMSKLPEFCMNYSPERTYNWWTDYLVIALQLLNKRELEDLYCKLPLHNCPGFAVFYDYVLKGRGYWYIQYFDPDFSIDPIQKIIVEKFK